MTYKNRKTQSRTVHIRTAVIDKPKRRGWTAEEDELLIQGIADYGVGNWVMIREGMRLDRTNMQIKVGELEFVDL